MTDAAHDIIVIGGGSAGCAMAVRLTDAGLSVLLVEAGKGDRDLRLLVPALTMATIHNPDYDWGYPAEPDPSIGGRADKWPAGRRLGGRYLSQQVPPGVHILPLPFKISPLIIGIQWHREAQEEPALQWLRDQVRQAAADARLPAPGSA